MNEIALSIGPGSHLVGVLTPGAAPLQPLAMLILNAGTVHRVGPHRIGVKLARHLAAAGCTTVRFDISGVGDSVAPKDAVEFESQRIRDVQTVMDHIEKEFGIRRFALFGICAGAVNAHAAALADARVVGAFMIDGYIYPTLKGQAIRLLAQWKAHGFSQVAVRALKRGWSSVRNRSARRPSDAPSTHPTRQEFAAQIGSLVDRGTQVALMFSGTYVHLYSYPGQLRDTFRTHRFVDRIACYFAPDIDHTMTPLATQQRLLAMVREWTLNVAGRGASDA
jgi:pimeloyl-ACP methyl ester carboxylesterase